MGKTKMRGKKPITNDIMEEPDFSNDVLNTARLNELLERLDSLKESVRYSSILEISRYLSSLPREQFVSLISTNMIKKLFQRFMDSCMEIRLVSCGIIKNMTIVGEEKVCECFINSNIMHILVTAFNNTLGEIQKLKGRTSEDDVKRYNLNLQILHEIIHLLSYLCENSEIATNNITSNQTFIPNTMTILSSIPPTPSSMGLICGSLELLNVVSDENDLFANNFRSINNSFKLLQGLMTNPKNGYTPYFRTILASIIYNVQTGSKDIIKTIIDPVFRSLSFQTVEELKKISPKLQELKILQSQGNEANPNQPIDLSISLKYSDQAKAQKLAFEIITNIIDSLPPNELPGFVMQKKVVETTLRLFDELRKSLSIPNPEKLRKEIYLIHQVLTRNISCMTNLVLRCDSKYLNKFYVGNVWNFIPNLLKDLCAQYEKTNTSFQALCIERILSLISVLLQKEGLNMRIEGSHTDHISFFRKLTNYPFSHIVRGTSLGVISQLVVRENNPTVVQLTEYANLCLTMCRDEHFVVVVDALNAIFDVFGVDKFNQVLKNVGMLGKLMSIDSWFRSNFKVDSFDEETVREVEETLENLKNFVEYKKSRL